MQLHLLLKTLLTKITVVSFVANKAENLKTIHIVMEKFESRTKQLLSKGLDVQKLEELIATLDDEIEEKVRSLYNLTEEEKRLIEIELAS